MPLGSDGVYEGWEAGRVDGWIHGKGDRIEARMRVNVKSVEYEQSYEDREQGASVTERLRFRCWMEIVITDC